MNNQKIKEIFLAAGFKEKDQGDGRMDLHAYVYEAANAIVAEATKAQRELMQHHSRLHDLATQKLESYEKVGEEIVSGVNHKGWQVGTDAYKELAALTAPDAVVFPSLKTAFTPDTVVCRRYTLNGREFYHYDHRSVYNSVPVTLGELIKLASLNKAS